MQLRCSETVVQNNLNNTKVTWTSWENKRERLVGRALPIPLTTTAEGLISEDLNPKLLEWSCLMANSCGCITAVTARADVDYYI